MSSKAATDPRRASLTRWPNAGPRRRRTDTAVARAGWVSGSMSTPLPSPDSVRSWVRSVSRPLTVPADCSSRAGTLANPRPPSSSDALGGCPWQSRGITAGRWAPLTVPVSFTTLRVLRCIELRRHTHRSEREGESSPLTEATREKDQPLPKERVERDEEDLVRLYLTDIGQYPLLTKDDEVRLAQAIEAGNAARVELEAGVATLSPARKRELRRCARDGEDAERTFVQSNLRLVVSIAKKYQASGLPLLDLIQEGNLGLMHAVEKFDWRKGFKFSTYATWWIRQAITRGIANTGRTIRLPVHAGDTLVRLQKARSRFELEHGRHATLAELARELDLPEEKVTELLLVAPDPVSLSEPVSEDGETELGDLVQDRSAESPFDAAARALLPAELEKVLSVLDERERNILCLRFGLDRGEPRTPDEVGEIVHLSRERVRQIEARALSRLRHPSADTGIRWLLAS